jgi:hypothetical protein
VRQAVKEQNWGATPVQELIKLSNGKVFQGRVKADPARPNRRTQTPAINRHSEANYSRSRRPQSRSSTSAIEGNRKYAPHAKSNATTQTQQDDGAVRAAHPETA